MGGSQLTQLKTALSSAGLNRKTASKKDKKQWKKGGSRETDRGKTMAKLEDIRKSLNKFDERETRVKYDVGGRNLKGVTGRPSASKQAGLEQRRKNLLPEHQLKGHTGTFRDRRFGESDPSMTVEDRMLERYTRERQRGQGKKGMFNIEDEDEGLDGFDEGEALGGLTHGGRSVSDLPGDDFMLQGLGDDDDDEDEDVKHGRIDRRVVGRGHFGGFEEEDEDLPEKKKSKAEVMSEIIAKSKEHKLERQKQREMDDDLRDELDEDLDGLRELLATAPVPDRSAAATALPGPSRQAAAPANGEQDKDYDQLVRTLGYEARAKPKDRTKTEDEMAIEEAERLQKAEAKRQRRMRGEDASDDEEDAEGGYKKRRKLERRGEADDLDDDFIDDEELLGPGLTREGIEAMAAPVRDEEDENEDGEDDEDDDEGSEEDDDEEEDDDDDDDDDEEVISDMEDLNDDEEIGLDSAESEEEEAIVKRSKAKGKGKATTKEIPFTFPCPASIEEFEDILEDLDASALGTVVQRIRAVHHPSLAQGNKERLQEFLGVLLDYTLLLAARPTPAFDLISVLTPHLIAFVKLNPISAAAHFISKITLMQKNLSRGLARGANRVESKTLPRSPELVLLRLVGTIWSTSDYSNPVVVPAVILMGQYLAQSRIRSTADIASGLFLCSILAQFESLSKRMLPEAVNFIASSLLILLPRRKDAKAVAYPDIKAPDVDLRLSSSSSASPADPVDLAAALGKETEQIKVDLSATALRLVSTYAAMYASHEAFIEIVTPLLTILEGSKLPKQSTGLKTAHANAQSTLQRMLGFATTSRQPLAMQAHKPIPIASFAPRFEDDFAPGKHYDPDAERNASNKLKALYKKERKGAIRELRKDNRFLAGEKAREQADKDSAYNAKMRRVEGEINVERAEEKEMQREKAKEKRRAGRK